MAHTNGHIEPITAEIAQRELSPSGRGRPGNGLVIALLAIIALLRFRRAKNLAG